MLRYWLDRLEDPFEMFPLQSVARDLAKAAEESEGSRFSRAGPWGVSPKYYSVEDEDDIEVVELVIGSVFVLGQAAITQSLSIVKKMHQIAGRPAWIPSGKDAIMSLESPVHAGSGLNKIAILNGVANYFKHRHECWDDWTGPDSSKATIDIATRLGLEPKGYHNLEHALRELEIYTSDMSPVLDLIQEWRERVAAHFRAQLDKRGL